MEQVSCRFSRGGTKSCVSKNQNFGPPDTLRQEQLASVSILIRILRPNKIICLYLKSLGNSNGCFSTKSWTIRKFGATTVADSTISRNNLLVSFQ